MSVPVGWENDEKAVMILHMNNLVTLPGKALRILKDYLRRLWVRVVGMGVLAIFAIGISQLVEGALPARYQGLVSGEAADRLLNIIASAMLAVTIFSLTVMVSTYQATSAQFTPRIHQLIREDAVTQNTLATFIGTYVYALTAIVLRELGYFGDQNALVPFAVTVLVMALIVWSLIRWMQHLQTLGSLIDSARQVERMTRAQFHERLDPPCLGATPLTEAPPEEGFTIEAHETGYVQIIHPEPLQQFCEEKDLQIYLLADIGSFVFVQGPIVRVVGAGDAPDDETRKAVEKVVRHNIVLGDERTFDQDPRFGLQTMSQIASKALSPGINDPGTAIDILNRSGRILWNYRDETASEKEPVHPRLHVRPLDPRDLIRDAFDSIARDGAGMREVQHRFQRVLAGLMRHPDEALRDVVRERAEEYLERALEAIEWEPDRERLRAGASANLEIE